MAAPLDCLIGDGLADSPYVEAQKRIAKLEEELWTIRMQRNQLDDATTLLRQNEQIIKNLKLDLQEYKVYAKGKEQYITELRTEVAMLKQDKRKPAHMCRMDHVEIWHNDSEHEDCPLCRVITELEKLKRNTNESNQMSEEKYFSTVDPERFVCEICKSKGFEPSITGLGCTFCDGTEGGNPSMEGEK